MKKRSINNRCQDRTDLNISGVVLLIPSISNLDGGHVQAYADQSLETAVGDAAVTDNNGRFEIDAQSKELPSQLWFKWSRGEASGRTPILNPYSVSEGMIRIPCYESTSNNSEPSRRETYSGRLKRESGVGVANVTVWLVEQTLHHAKKISVDESNQKGFYEVHYNKSLLINVNQPDLRVIVVNSDGIPIIETSQKNIVIPDNLISVSWAEDVAVREAVEIFQNNAAKGVLRAEDIEYLIRHQGVSSRSSTLMRKAAELSNKASICLMEALMVVAAGKEASPREAVKTAIRKSWINPDVEKELETIEEAVEDSSGRDLIHVDKNHRSLDEILEHRLKDRKTRLKAVRVWRESIKTHNAFADRIAKIPEITEKNKEISFTVEVATHADRHFDLVRALERRYDAEQIQAGNELAAWEEPEWEALLDEENIEIPDEFTGDDEKPVSQFAVHLRKKFERAYPNEATRAHFSRHASTYPWGKAVQTAIDEHPAIDISMPVARLEKKHPELFSSITGREVRQGLAVVQRLQRLTQSLRPIPKLVEAGLGSARAIALTSPTIFAQRFASAFGGNHADAVLAHDNAVRIANLAKLTYAELAPKFHKTPLAVLRDPVPTSEQQKGLDAWRDTFGSDDLAFCECAHCKSIFGPAAYLFDMLLFLDRFALQVPAGKPSKGTPSVPSVRPRRFSALTFLNCVQVAERIVEWVQDDPEFLIGSPRTRGISLELAEKILERREAIGGRFSSLQQVQDIDGIGPDTMHDIIHTSWGKAGPVAVAFALQIINEIIDAQNITWITVRIKDDPNYQSSSENAVGVTEELAAQIIEYRDSEEIGGVFTSLSQVAKVPGVGADTLHDIISSFYEEAIYYTEIPWAHFSSAPKAFQPITAYGDTLFAVDGGGTLWYRSLAQENSSWNETDFSFDMYVPRGLAISPEGLFVTTDASSEGDLLFLDSPFEPNPVRVGSAPDIIAMTYLGANLYAVTSHNRVLKINTVNIQNEQWSDIGHAGNITTITASNGKLYGATSDNKLLMRFIYAEDAPWIEIGEAGNVVALATIGVSLIGITEECELWVRGVPSWEVPKIPTLLDNLRLRRPDVPALLLSCANTNIEVPHIDLVNELLAQMVGESICSGFIESMDSLGNRTTSGTSEERRAWPEHEPAKVVLNTLKRATRPWMLPYDYERDRAEQARQTLPGDENAVVEANWLFESLSDNTATGRLESAKLLALHALGMTPAETGLITEEALDLRPIWGDEVADLLGHGQSPFVASLQRAGQLEFIAIEDALESEFVRQAVNGDPIAIRPATTCDPEQLVLDAPVEILPVILDRVHRFERLRRKVGWKANELDNVLRALNHKLEEDELVAVGLLLHLQNCLKLSPDKTLALFTDPLTDRPFVLRSEKRVLSAFERLFGTEPVVLPLLTDDSASDMKASDVVVASIAQRVGTGPDEVMFVLQRGYAELGGAIFSHPIDILTETNPLHAWQNAVAAVYRAIRFSSALDLSLTDFDALAELYSKPFLLRSGVTVSLLEQLISAVDFVGLAHEAAKWPLPASEVQYLTTTNAKVSRVFGLDALQMGSLFTQVRETVRQIHETSNVDGVESIGDLLTEIIGQADSTVSGAAGSEKAVDRIQRMIEWSSVFTAFKNQVVAELTENTLLASDVTDPSTSEVAEARQTFSDALALIPQLFLKHLAQVGITGIDSTAEYQHMLEAFLDAIEATLHEPNVQCVDNLFTEIESPLSALGLTDEGIRNFASLSLADAVQTVSTRMSGVRQKTTQHWLEALSSAARRKKIDSAVIENFAKAFSLELPQASQLLTRLLRDPNVDQPLLRAFVSRDGTTPNLDTALVEASYANVDPTTQAAAQLVVNRMEGGLQFDWAAYSPPPGVDPNNFEVSLNTTIATNRLCSNSEARRLVVQSTGRVTVKLISGTDEAEVLNFDAEGSMHQEEWDSTAVETFFMDSSPQSDNEVGLNVEFVTASVSSVSGTTSVPRLQLLVESDDGELVPLVTGLLGRALTRFDKAARMVRSLLMPPVIWNTLASLPENNRVTLNDLPIDTGQNIELWQEVNSLQQIWSRRIGEEDINAYIGIVTGNAISLNAISRVLNLTASEVHALLEMLGIDVEVDATEVSLIMGWRPLDVALRLSDLARSARLPLAAIRGWTVAPSNEFYQWSLGALRALGSEEEWFKVLQHIYDPVREHLRDALVAWLTTHPRISSDGRVLSPFSRAEDISDYLFTDVQMSACMMSSRVQFGYAAVQKYVDAMRLGFEPGPQEAKEQEQFEREWTWRRFYRLWEANRRVFAYPENWLEPDLRLDKTPFFRELEEELLEGPLTNQSAENALANYLGKLVDVARPEIVGIINGDELPDNNSPLGFHAPDLRGTHVIGRSRSQPYKFYYRRRLPSTDYRWTPWELIEAELPGTHLIPVIAFRRLYLISAEFGLGKKLPDPCEQASGSQATEQSGVPRQTANVVLSWIERRNGQWSSVRRSEVMQFEAPEIRIKQTGLDSSWDDVFPSEQYQEVRHEYADSSNINWVSISVKMGDDGIHKHLEQTTYLVIFLIVNQSGNEVRFPIGSLDNIGPYETGTVSWSIPDTAPTNIVGFYFQYQSREPVFGRGDWCKIKKLSWVFKNVNDKEFQDYEEASSEETGLKQFDHTNDVWEYEIDVDTTETTSYHWNDNNVRPYFEVEVIAEYSPIDAYAFHAESLSDFSGGSLVLQLLLSEGVELKIAGTPRFRFIGSDNLPEDLMDNWGDNWHKGNRPLSRCITGNTQFEHLLTIEIFSDNTVKSVLPIHSNTQIRGNYLGTSPWRQRFRQEITTNLALGSGLLPFYSGGESVLHLENSYDVIVQNRDEISSDVSPKVLDEFSDLSDGVTLFSERNPDTQSYALPWMFRVFSHPQAVGFLRLLQAYGVPRFLSHNTQTLDDQDLYFEKLHLTFFSSAYPNNAILEQPGADVDFTLKGAYSDYNWELFFQAPLYIAQRLSESGQFEDAERWFKLLFDPSQGRLNANPQESFQTRPLREAVAQRLKDMLYMLDDQVIRDDFSEQVDRLNRFPYQPHLIARSRVSAFQKTLVMKYLDHLIAWGDELFRRAYASDNRTELENAGSRYDLVAKILGKRPEVLPSQLPGSIFSYDALRANKDPLDLWDPLVRLEDYLRDDQDTKDISVDGSVQRPSDPIDTSSHDETRRPVSTADEGLPEYLYFCVPHNKELLKYWDILADRLSKLRSCRDKDGAQRVLSLYGQQIDPGLLVRATAMGLDIDVLLGYVSAPIPKFRFSILLQRARNASDRAQSFGQALLSAIEKRESEELARLRSRHELALIQASKHIRDEQVNEARESLEALRKSRESAEERHRFYSTRQRLNVKEIAENVALDKAAQNDQLATGASASAADLAFIPNFPVSARGGYTTGSWFYEISAGVNYDFGGQFLSKFEERKALGHRQMAEYNRTESSRLGRQAQYDRRWDDWQLQRELAEKDLEQIDRQMNSAEIRVRIAEIELENQLQQIDQAANIDAYLRDKFTNAKLYRWMESRLSRLYYQQYRVAYDLALKAQRALRYELGLEEDSILPDTWNPTYRGLEAASDLQHELEKLETRYLDSWRREHEKTKVFSIADRWPLEFLELRKTGTCVIQILEHDLDEDEPGDYFRRIKQVSVDIPCIQGPYDTVNARFTLLRSETRIKPYSTGGYARPVGLDGANDNRFRDDMGGTEHIVTSSAVNDTGQFDKSVNSDRLSSFEGSGVIGTWQIDLRQETNRVDLDTVSNVVLRILYTARDGGEMARAAAMNARNDYLNNRGRTLMLPLSSTFSNAWNKFVSSLDALREFELSIESKHMPLEFQKRSSVTISNAEFYLEMDIADLEVNTSSGWIDPVEPYGLDGCVRLTPANSLVLGELSSLQLTGDSGIPSNGWVIFTVKTGAI